MDAEGKPRYSQTGEVSQAPSYQLQPSSKNLYPQPKDKEGHYPIDAEKGRRDNAVPGPEKDGKRGEEHCYGNPSASLFRKLTAQRDPYHKHKATEDGRSRCRTREIETLGHRLEGKIEIEQRATKGKQHNC